jgi:hypothetical protein
MKFNVSMMVSYHYSIYLIIFIEIKINVYFIFQNKFFRHSIVNNNEQYIFLN